MSPDLCTLRQQTLATYQAVYRLGLAQGTSGNVSARYNQGMVITPSGLPLESTEADDMLFVSLRGESLQGDRRPSSEWQLHAAIYQLRPDAQAVVHCHSRHATILACAGRAVPSMHYMVAATGRSEIPLVPYHRFGTEALATAVAAHLRDGDACLMANHGQIALGKGLASALALAAEVEEQCAIYWGTLAIGGPQLLNEAEISEVMERFRSYGQLGEGD